MSFEEKYDEIFEDLIKPSTKKANEILRRSGDQVLVPFRTKDDIRTTSGWMNVLENLTTAQIVLGVLTGNNVNVFYELGIAHATQPISRQILIAQKGFKPSFDTKDLIYFPYDSHNLEKDIPGLAEKIADAIRVYNIEKEKVIMRARQSLGPYDLEVVFAYSNDRNFSLKTSKDFEIAYEERHGQGSLNRHVQGITNLCQHGLLALNTFSEQLENEGTRVEFSYYWTNLSSDLLYYMKLINEQALEKRRILPDSITQ
jgi:hypothetical protein